ncbi:MAG: class I SAM-dependent methyltransferase [Betaproteobacteria bacterium]|jgi:SAM-dependent methyltransferase|nr:class I SAM-dependent methyltransferase [Betaproteobacteria bacterium]
MTEDLRVHYQNLLADHGDNYASAQYSSQASQEARYVILSQVGNIKGSRVLDWGCGTGHLASWIANQGIDCDYTGVDIVPEFLDIARKKHPQHRFGEMQDFEKETFDWIMISGVFNNRMDDNLAFFRRNIAYLWDRCTRGLSFNLMSSWVDFEDPKLWYVRPEDVFVILKSLTPFVAIRNDYLVKDIKVPYEFAVYAYRNPRWSPS